MPLEVAHKFIEPLGIGLIEGGTVDRVVLDDIDLGRYAAAELDEVVGVLARIVKSLKGDVLEGDRVARLLVEVLKRVGEYLQVIAFVDGHDLVALLVVGSVQRER